MPKSQFPIGSIVTIPSSIISNIPQTGLVVGYNPPAQSKLGRDRYNIYFYNMDIFDYPPASWLILKQLPTNASKQEVQTKILDLLSQPPIHKYKIGDVLGEFALEHIVLDNGRISRTGSIQYHIATHSGDKQYYMHYISEHEMQHEHFRQFPATAESKQLANKIILEHMLQPIF